MLIDDLITKGTEEPYRMFTSRAEYRTLLRQDNADERLTPSAHKIGLATEERLREMENKREASEKMVQFFRNTSILPEEVNDILSERGSSPMKQSDKMFKVFSRPQIAIEDIKRFEKVAAYIEEHNIEKAVLEQAEIKVKYAGYIAKEKLNADKLNRLENIRIPDDFDYSKLKSLSFEAKEKLSNIRPTSISQASRISGVSPSDISVLLVYMGR